MIAPPGYPNSTSTPASTSVRQRMCAPLWVSVMGSDSPKVRSVQRLAFELVRVTRLVEGVHQRAGARLDDVRRGTMAGQRLAVHPHLHHHLTEAVAPRRDRLHGQVQNIDLASHDASDLRERGGDGSVALAGGAPLPGPWTGERDVGCG